MCNILIVDDNQIERTAIGQILRNAFDFIEEIVEASNVKASFSLLSTMNIHATVVAVPFITDLLKLSSYVKQSNPHCAIILISAKSEKEAALTSAKMEADGYLLKPFPPARIIHMMKRIVLESNRVYQPWEEDVSHMKSIRVIKDCLREHIYKKSITEAKQYINHLYDSNQQWGTIREKQLAFINSLADIARDYSQDIHHEIHSEAALGKLYLEQHEGRYKAYKLLEQYLMNIFWDVEKGYVYTDDTKKMMNYIDINIRKKLTLDQVADHINVSPCYFSKLFKKAMNQNFVSYITDQKIKLAKEMLIYTDIPIVNISYDLSYAETNYFSKAFKKLVGQTPTEFRNNHSNETLKLA